MRILITGAAGRIARHTAEHLAQRGHKLILHDRHLAPDDYGAPVIGDLADVDGICDAMAGCDAILHLAAIPVPWRAPIEELFRINTSGAFNVYTAAARTGVKRVVSASSINTLGRRFGREPVPVDYLPVDERHPGVPTDVYGFSKTIVESIADYHWRLAGISGSCIRMGERMALDPEPFSDDAKALMADLIARIGRGARRELKARVAELFELKARGGIDAEPDLSDMNPVWAEVAWGVVGLWTTIDWRDRAQAFAAALERPYEGSHALFICDNHNALGLPSADLARLCYPEARLARPLMGTESLVTIAAAQELLGFAPEHSLAGRW